MDSPLSTRTVMIFGTEMGIAKASGRGAAYGDPILECMFEELWQVPRSVAACFETVFVIHRIRSVE